MPRLARFALLTLTAVAGLLVVAGAIVALSFDGNDVKSLATERMQRDFQRRLTIGGAVEFRYLPRLGLQIGAASLSEPGGGGMFAAVESAHASLVLWPLLRGQLVLGRVQVQGLRATVTRRADGRTSIDDLLHPPAPRPAALAASAALAARAPMQFDLDGVLTIDAGAWQAEARWSGPLRADLERRVVSSARTELALNGRHGATAIRGSLATAWVADLPSASVMLTNLAVDAVLPNPRGGTLAWAAQGSAGFDLTPQRVDARLAGQLDDSRFDGRIALLDFAKPAGEFEFDVDRIDLDRYRAPDPSGVAAPPAGAGGDPSPLDLSALRDLNVKGRVRVGQVRLAGLTARQLRAELHARDGRLDIAPLTADLYQGRASGSLSLAAGSPPRLSTRQAWSGIAVGPLLKDARGEERLTGRGDLVVDLRTQGGTVAALTKALDGQARIELRDGLVRGVNVAQIVRSAAAVLGRGPAPPAGTAAASDATDFSELSGSFRIQHGVAHNDDLRARTPLLNVKGRGQIDLVAGRLDYLVKATVTDTLAGQGGPEWQALRGQTVPVRLSGPFGAIGYRVDAARLVQDLARKTLEEKARDALPAAQQRLLEKFKGLLGK